MHSPSAALADAFGNLVRSRRHNDGAAITQGRSSHRLRGTIGAVPLSAIDSARQAYQEIHISNLFGTLANAVLCAGLLLTARWAPTLPAFVAVTALTPLAVRLFECGPAVRAPAVPLRSTPWLWFMGVGAAAGWGWSQLYGRGSDCQCPYLPVAGLLYGACSPTA